MASITVRTHYTILLNIFYTIKNIPLVRYRTIKMKKTAATTPTSFRLSCPRDPHQTTSPFLCQYLPQTVMATKYCKANHITISNL
jgi:hypothetical protein